MGEKRRIWGLGCSDSERGALPVKVSGGTGRQNRDEFRNSRAPPRGPTQKKRQFMYILQRQKAPPPFPLRRMVVV